MSLIVKNKQLILNHMIVLNNADDIYISTAGFIVMRNYDDGRLLVFKQRNISIYSIVIGMANHIEIKENKVFCASNTEYYGVTMPLTSALVAKIKNRNHLKIRCTKGILNSIKNYIAEPVYY